MKEFQILQQGINILFTSDATKWSGQGQSSRTCSMNRNVDGDMLVLYIWDKVKYELEILLLSWQKTLIIKVFWEDRITSKFVWFESESDQEKLWGAPKFKNSH